MTNRHTIASRLEGERAKPGKSAATKFSTASEHPVMQLQRSIGNKAIETMISSALPNKVQTKLSVGPAGDMYEQEADQVGQMVADKLSSADGGAAQSVQREEGPEEESEDLMMKRSPDIQREEGLEEEGEDLMMKRSPEGIQREEGLEEEGEDLMMKRSPEGIQREEGLEEEGEDLMMKRSPEGIQREEGLEEEGEDLMMKRSPEGIQREEGLEEEGEDLMMKRSPESIQRDEGSEEESEQPLTQEESKAGFDTSSSLEQEIEQSRGNGSNMDTQVQAKFESAFNTSFKGVKVHTDANADRMSRSIGASAFTTGSDVFFRQGQYNPGTRQGNELIGHELTHVVQQRGGK
ncbi:MAG: hypothetical protein K0Q59_724 [Paenibacillus sp.]|nr:hypothetical protein [Paenibacillus sp.]